MDARVENNWVLRTGRQAVNFDTLTRAHPSLGFAVYQVEPGDPVTLEVYDGNNVYTFTGATLAEAIEKAFPPVVSQPPPSEGLSPSLRAAQEPEGPRRSDGAVGGGAETTGSVFD